MGSEQRVKTPPSLPVLIFDGDCGFCRFWKTRWQYRSGSLVEYTPYQSADIAQRFPEIPLDRCARAVQFVEPDGRASEAAEAVFRLLASIGLRLPIYFYEAVPGVRAVSEAAYRAVAQHRNIAARATTMMWGRDPRPPTYALARWLFFRLLSLVYLAAFWSLGTQILGLAGHSGIVPAGVDDAWLRGVCVSGSILATLLLVGLAPVVILPLLWAGYLWLSTITGPFLSFQWDALLLETGLLAIFLAPISLRDRLRGADDPPRLGVWLMVWLLFRLMMGSGGVKLASGDPTWRDLTALSFHYETQPIPTPLAWWAHHFPAWFNHASTAGVLGIELLAPIVMLGPRRLRCFACAWLVGLQALIASTGNYAFFNLLSVALCVFLLDDVVLERAARWFHRPETLLNERGLRRPQNALLIAVALVTVPVSALHFAAGLGLEMPGLAIVLPLARLVAPLRSVNGYGLFAVMTTTRDEIVIEGSDDGTRWQEYEFRYKAGDLRRAPPWVAPHQPRLDWQMWFASLSRFDDEPWFQAFCVRLLEGSPDVLRLLERDPFAGHPPRSIRGVLYRYHFSDAAARRQGVWWTRERLGLYSPALTLRASDR
ncbi:MAG TPA: lipase maturation factor family protein [Vicinamibacterales bacterium]|nr:lipase maturation factor family protein [Vicinamibacterales bacterium]